MEKDFTKTLNDFVDSDKFVGIGEKIEYKEDKKRVIITFTFEDKKHFLERYKIY